MTTSNPHLQGYQSSIVDDAHSQGSEAGRNSGFFAQTSNRASMNMPQLPSTSLPKGGGAIHGMGEKFEVATATGGGNATIPIRISPGRNDVNPTLNLSYSSGAGNGPFGLGWHLSHNSITRKTDKGLPLYSDYGSEGEADVFLLSNAEDLVPVYKRKTDGSFVVTPQGEQVIDETPIDGYLVRKFMPRTESFFSRIERWTNLSDPSDIYWRSISGTNVTTVFGSDSSSRIFDPEPGTAKQRIYSWMVSEVFDATGNAMIFEYKAEDSASVDIRASNEANRTDTSRSANRYVKTIRYGNQTPNRNLQSWAPFPAKTLPRQTWMFSVVFDYGEHDVQSPSATESKLWDCRTDPFSTFRPGFEVRTYRLCRRIFMFHHFSELGATDTLVASTDLEYRSDPSVTYLTNATLVGYSPVGKDGTQIQKRLPPLTFEYSKFPTDMAISETPVHAIDQLSSTNMPVGLDSSQYQWVDLDMEGISGILTEQGHHWFYKRNMGGPEDPTSNVAPQVKFGDLEIVHDQPSFSTNDTSLHFGDVTSGGKLDLISMEPEAWGYFERETGEGWVSFKTFKSFPNLPKGLPGIKMVDLTGDGIADVLFYSDNTLTWFPSLAEDGYGPGHQLSSSIFSDMGSSMVSSDGQQTIYLADMSGDGLNDIVRVRNSSVEYWPNLGYGQFGEIVAMDNCPCFNTTDSFSITRLHLTDIDGSGTADIIYTSQEGIDIYRNQCGNSFGDKKRISSFPGFDNSTVFSTVDMFGSGTMCLVWSSGLPNSAPAPMRYMDLMGRSKPHLLTKMYNNLGSETTIYYTSSTKFYLQDRAAGHPWITRLPFPVQCVEKTEVVDMLSGNRLTSNYSYRHGYFDSKEREFRGFALVEQWDTEAFEAMDGIDSANQNVTSYVPPVHTKSWFHTGAYLPAKSVARQLSMEYFGAPIENDADTTSEFLASILGDSVLPDTVTDAQEMGEAYRSLKGRPLRTEVYAEDRTSKAGLPYTVTEVNYAVDRLQPRFQDNSHAVFAVRPRENISYHYERNIEDPRIEHELALQIDPFGTVQKGIKIAYGRRPDVTTLAGNDKIKQEMTFLLYFENDVTEILSTASDYRLPISCETRQYELSGLQVGSGNSLFKISDFISNDFRPLKSLQNIPFEQQNQPSSMQKRLLQRTRHVYRRDDLSGLLSVGKIQAVGLPGMSYDACLTPGLIELAFKRKTSGGRIESLLPQPASILSGTSDQQAGYIDLDGDGNWWIPSGQAFYAINSTFSASDELAQARRHFFLPKRFVGPFGQASLVQYDTHDMFPLAVTDPVGNVSLNSMDYRVLQPNLVTDPNGNQNAVAFDAMGLVVASAVMGKAGERVGDSIEGLKTDLSQNDIDAFFDNPKGPMAAFLIGNATSRIVYDLSRYQRLGGIDSPSYSATITREDHVSSNATELKTQIGFTYSDGFGRSMQVKGKSTPGPLEQGGPVVANRWVGSGWTIFNNKGKPVKQFEPFFDNTHDYKRDMKVGVSPILLYDPLLRVVATFKADHALEKTTFDAWSQSFYDVNDNVMLSDPRKDPDVGHFFSSMPKSEYSASWYEQRIDGSLGPDEKAAAEKIVAHADTPRISHTDALGHEILTLNDNGPGGILMIQSNFNIQGNQTEVFDAKSRLVSNTLYDMRGNRLYYANMDSGERWILSDISGSTLMAWDNRGFRHRNLYDELRRPVASYLVENTKPEVLVQKVTYGDLQGLANPPLHSRTRVVKTQDQAGVNSVLEYDFKGNTLRSSLQLANNYKDVLDWSGQVSLDSEIYNSSATFDALNRSVESVTFDGTIKRRLYNDTGRLDSLLVNIKAEVGSNGPIWTEYVSGMEYNAKGQVLVSKYGNGVSATNTYDSKLYRLQQKLTTRDSGAGSTVLQNLNYAYDAVGNVVSVKDDALQTLYFRNVQVTPSTDYTYDALYRLIQATGREHLGQNQAPNVPDAFDTSNTRLIAPGDGSAMGLYTESYSYDDADNITEIKHAGSDSSKPGWTRSFRYNEASMLNSTTGRSETSNRLSGTSVGNTTETYSYDGDAGLHGNMTSMPQLSQMGWDFLDQLKSSSIQVVNNGGVPETTYYVYDSSGKRVRKVTERQAAAGTIPTMLKETRYVGTLYIHRQYSGDGTTVTVERETVDLNGESGRLALVETRTQGGDVRSPARLVRYQFGNHIGSAAIELEDSAQVISYEEYFPFGSTSYQAMSSTIETPKSYRFGGQERDVENGLYYQGARYYAPWVGRWVNADPIGIAGGLNEFFYCKNNPVTISDPLGTDGLSLEEEAAQRNARRAPGSLTPDEIADVYKDVHDVPKDLVVKPPSEEAAMKQQGRIDAGKANRVAAKKELAANPPLTKDEAWDVAKGSAKNWLLDKESMAIKANMILNPTQFFLLRSRLDENNAAHAPQPPEFIHNLRDYQIKENYEFMQGTLNTAETAASFIPVGEILQGAKLALGKLPSLSGMGMLGGGQLTSASKIWAAGGDLRQLFARTSPEVRVYILAGPKGVGTGNNILYIGETVNAQGRYYAHMAKYGTDWNGMTIISNTMTKDEALQLEAYLIQRVDSKLTTLLNSEASSLYKSPNALQAVDIGGTAESFLKNPFHFAEGSYTLLNSRVY